MHTHNWVQGGTLNHPCGCKSKIFYDCSSCSDESQTAVKCTCDGPKGFKTRNSHSKGRRGK